MPGGLARWTDAASHFSLQKSKPHHLVRHSQALFAARLCQSVTAVALDPYGLYLAVCGDDHEEVADGSTTTTSRVFFVDAVSFRVLGHHTLPRALPVHAMAWTAATQDATQLTVSVGAGDLYFLSPPPLDRCVHPTQVPPPPPSRLLDGCGLSQRRPDVELFSRRRCDVPICSPGLG